MGNINSSPLPNNPNERTMVIAVFDRYTQLRQTGTPVETTKQRLQPVVAQLTRDEIAQLVQLTRAWEARFAAKPGTGTLKAMAVNMSNRDSRMALPTDETGRRTPQTPPGSQFGYGNTPAVPDSSAAPDVRRTIRRITPTNPKPSVDQYAENNPSARASNTFVPPSLADDRLMCGNCGKLNRKGEQICYACGVLLLPSLSQTRSLESTDLMPDRGSEYFARSSSLVLFVTAIKKSVESLIGDEATIGRFSTESVVQPDIDLAPFDSERLGVSRVHAKLIRSADTLTLLDLKSRNHTYLNGQRIYPNEVRVLHDGDEIRLGKLALRTIFRHNG